MILAISRLQPFDPATFIGERWTIWRGSPDGNGLEGDEQQDARSLLLKEVGFTLALFETCLAAGETAITGEERLASLQKKGLICPDAKIGQALYEEPGQKTLRWLYETFEVTWFELPGTVLRDECKCRYLLYLCRRADGYWIWFYRLLDFTRLARNPALVFAPSECGA